jgi:hypothetical protein
VAWLAAAGRAPVLPMGFGGVPGAFGAIFSFRFPRISVGIGAAIPFPAGSNGGAARRDALDEHAERVLDAIETLIPADLRPDFVAPEREEFTATVLAAAADGTERPVALEPGEARNLGFLFFHPVLLRTFSRNLRLRTACLEDIAAPIPSPAVRDAVADILRYLDVENRFFFAYRVGAEEAASMRAAFAAVHAAAAAPGVVQLRFAAERRWRLPGDGEDRIELLPGDAALRRNP